MRFRLNIKNVAAILAFALGAVVLGDCIVRLGRMKWLIFNRVEYRTEFMIQMFGGVFTCLFGALLWPYKEKSSDNTVKSDPKKETKAVAELQPVASAEKVIEVPGECEPVAVSLPPILEDIEDNNEHTDIDTDIPVGRKDRKSLYRSITGMVISIMGGVLYAITPMYTLLSILGLYLSTGPKRREHLALTIIGQTLSLTTIIMCMTYIMSMFVITAGNGR